jgi:hypothetical protein
MGKALPSNTSSKPEGNQAENHKRIYHLKTSIISTDRLSTKAPNKYQYEKLYKDREGGSREERGVWLGTADESANARVATGHL